MRIAFLLLALSCAVYAQPPVCCTVSPNPLVLGTGSSVTITATDATGAGFEYQSQCLASTVRVGMPNGPFAPIAISLCGASYVPVAPGGSASKNFGFLGGLGTGTYYVDVKTRPIGGGTLVTTWVPFHIVNPTDPILSETAPPQVGMPYNMSIAAPNNASNAYFMAGSLSTNTGAMVSSLFVSLDFNDPLFALTFPNPLPGVFVNFAGITDPSGNATGIVVNVPNDPGLVGLPVNFQAILLDGFGGEFLTNTIPNCITP